MEGFEEIKIKIFKYINGLEYGTYEKQMFQKKSLNY